MENWRRRKQRSGNEGRGSNGGRIGKFENMKKDDERRGEGRERKGKKEDAKGQSGRRVLKDESRRKREHPPSGSRVFVCVCVSLCVYIYIKSRKECCHGKKLESSLKMTAPFAVAHAAVVLAMVGRDSMVIYVLRHDGSYTRGTKR